MPDYFAAQKKAKSMIERFGQKATLRHEGRNREVVIAKNEYSLGLVGTNIAAGTQQIYMEAVDFEPIPNEDILYINKKPYKIIPPIRKLDPAGVVIFYELQVQGA